MSDKSGLMVEIVMLDLHKLNIFNIVVREGSFSAAAEHLYMSQSAVSQHMRDLEISLGTDLFNRGRRGVTLTPAGKTLYGYSRQILKLLGEAESAVTRVENLESGQLRIGSTPGVSSYLLPDWIGAFRAQYPNITVTLQTETTTRIATAVLDHQLDLGFVEGELNEMKSERLGFIALDDIELFVVVGQDHPFRGQAHIPITALDQQPFITRQIRSRTRIWLDDLLRPYGIQPRIVAEFDNPESIKHAVRSGMGITILPRYTVQRDVDQGMLHALTIEEIPLRRTLKLLCDTQTPFNPITRAFLLVLAETYPHLREAMETIKA